MDVSGPICGLGFESSNSVLPVLVSDFCDFRLNIYISMRKSTLVAKRTGDAFDAMRLALYKRPRRQRHFSNDIAETLY